MLDQKYSDCAKCISAAFLPQIGQLVAHFGAVFALSGPSLFEKAVFAAPGPPIPA